MKWRRFRPGFTLGLAVCLTWFLTSAQASGQDACTLGVPDTCYGDGSDDNVTVAVDTVLTRDMNYRNLTVSSGVTLDTAGYTVRVCATLTNEGTITDEQSGGGSGPTDGGRGQDPCEDSGGPPQAEDGSCICLSWAPDPGSLAGGGGGCGGSGAGGGGAKWLTPCGDADGGDGGDGGHGGRGGGWVRVYAYNLDNQGLIHADGEDGQPGEPGSRGGYWYIGRCRDLAGGGGGGGAGGGGGDGGTVEIYYADPSSNLGTRRADAGLGAPGGDAGTSGGCCVCLDVPDYETSGLGGFGCPLGGDGGDGAWQQGTCAEAGEPGGAGLDGAPGQVSSFGPEACCLGDGSCLDVDPFCCADLTGTAQGSGTMCAAPQACCRADDTCEMLDPLCCADQGGAPQGEGTACTAETACCLEDNTCQKLDPLCCLDLDPPGEPKDPGTECDPNPCPQACCLTNGICVDLEVDACSTQGGSAQGSDTACSAPGACCLPDGACLLLDPLCCDDLEGEPQGPGTICQPDGACCLPDGSCLLTIQDCCEHPSVGGTYQGDGTACLGLWACCLGGGTTCLDRDQMCCDELGGYLGYEDQCRGEVNTSGVDFACLPHEACCLPDDTCADLPPSDCVAQFGTAQGPGTVCTQPRACCLSGLTPCVEVDPLCCDGFGGYLGDGDDCLGDLNSNGIDDACEPEYTIIDLGTLPGYDESCAYAINEAGQVVGGSDGSLYGEAVFIWVPRPDCRLRPGISALPSGGFGAFFPPYDINDDGTVVGTAFRFGFPVNEYDGFWWPCGDDQLYTLLAGCGGNHSGARAVNDGGTVAGWSDDYDHPEACYWPTVLVEPTCSQIGGEANDVNTHGVLVGVTSNGHAFRWDGGTQGIDDLGTGGAYGINDSDVVVGESGGNAVKWVGTSGIVLGPGAAYAINNAGQVVGESEGHAVLWENGGTTDLNDLLPPDSGWELLVAWDINEAAQIVGQGLHDGDLRAFLLNSYAGDCNTNGIPDGRDIAEGTSEDCQLNGIPDECEADTDGDTVPDTCDNCPDDYNPSQEDLDHDGIGDACDGPGACCQADVCIPSLRPGECAASNGIYLGDGTTCGLPTNPCTPGACCEPDGGCTDTAQVDCSPPDVYHPGVTCAQYPCPTLVADECVDAELINLTRGSAQLQGYNAHATARWGTCSTSGAVCYTTNGIQGWDGSCPYANDVCQRDDPFADPFYSCFWGGGDSTGLNTVWYKFVAAEPSMFIQTCNSAYDPWLYDTALVLYSGECGNLTELEDPDQDPQYDGCGEDECPFGDPAAPWFSEICNCGLTVGETYYVEVINAGGTPGQFQLDIEYPCPDPHCLPGACCEFVGNRCYDFYDGSLEAVPVNTAGCESDADCPSSWCPLGGGFAECICLPYYECRNDTWPAECEAGNQRYGGNGTICEDAVLPRIDPPCGLGACCNQIDNCGEGQTPLECVGGISDGDSTWLGEGSECSDLALFEDLECPKACPINGICHPDLVPPCFVGDGHPYDGESLYLADSTSNGICSASGICTTSGICSTSGATCYPGGAPCPGDPSDVCEDRPCESDAGCPGSELCLGDDVQIVADSFIPLDTPVSELCWRGVYMDEAGDDCSTNLIAGPSTFTIRFWEDTDCDALPGDAAGTGGLIAELVNITPQRSLSGFMWGVTNPCKEWEFHAEFVPVSLAPESCYWLEITATNSPENCDFWIETSTVGDDVVAVDSNADGTYDAQGGEAIDLAWLIDIAVKADDCRPANDDCATVIAGTNGLSHGARVPYQTTYASTDGPPHPKGQCGIGGLGNWTIENDIWYTYTAECIGTLTVDICTSGYDTMLAVYDLGSGVGTNGWICPTDETYLVGCNNDACGTTSTSGLQSRVVDDVTQGDKILIRVGGYEANDRGCGLLKLDLAPAGPEPCFEDADCQDGLYCNGADSCNQSTCQCEHTGDPCAATGLPCQEEYDGCGYAIAGAQSCQDHVGTEYCLDIGEGGTRGYDNVEPRMQLGVPLELEIIATGSVASNGVTVTVSCTPNPYTGTATVVTDGTNVGRVQFSGVLPDQAKPACCTLTFSGDIEDCWPIVILECDVNRDCQVSTADSSSIKGRLGDEKDETNFWYDVNRDCSFTTADKSSAKGRLEDAVTCPCTCP